MTGAGRWWSLGRRVLVVTFLVVTVALLVHVARQVAWAQVAQAVRALPASVLLGAGAAALASYAVYCCFDVLGRRYTGHHLPIWQIVPVTFVCYAFNLSLGSWVGSVGLRYRLYSRLGLDTITIGKVLTFSLATNWLGHGTLAAGLFASGWVTLPGRLAIGGRGLGLVWLAVVASYLAACAFARRRSFQVFGHPLWLPSWRLALVQVGLGSTNWVAMGLTVWILLQGQVPYPQVLGILLVSAVAGVAAHIPAGLGVVEAVFVTALEPLLPGTAVLAALLAYRAIYFLLPLAAAALVYVVLEMKAKALKARSAQAGHALFAD